MDGWQCGECFVVISGLMRVYFERATLHWVITAHRDVRIILDPLVVGSVIEATPTCT
jgi:hypothetical protein